MSIRTKPIMEIFTEKLLSSCIPLRYVMGDDLFFATLKKLATDPQYTYDNTVTTNDVEKLFSTAYGKSLKPLFDLFLYSTDKLEISVKQMDTDKYIIQSLNLDYEIPIEVMTSAGMQKIKLAKIKTAITSSTMPIIDPNVFYLKKVIIE